MSGAFRRTAGQKWLGHLPYALLMIGVVLPMAVMVGLLAVRTGMFRVSGALDPRQTSTFLAFIGGWLGTAATVLGMLFTWQHNRRERYRLGLETVVKSLDCLESRQSPRVAGALASMVLLGHPRLALRVLASAWKLDQVDAEAATWLIGQILTSGSARRAKDGDPVDQSAVVEAAVLLREHAGKLTNDEPRSFSFPWHFYKQWDAEPELPLEAKEQLLVAMGKMLASRGIQWWASDGNPPRWPTEIFRQCAQFDRDPKIGPAAAVLFAELNVHFRDAFESSFKDVPDVLQDILRTGEEAKNNPYFEEYASLARDIRARWAPAGPPGVPAPRFAEPADAELRESGAVVDG